jgi:hypothetical protein
LRYSRVILLLGVRWWVEGGIEGTGFVDLVITGSWRIPAETGTGRFMVGIFEVEAVIAGLGLDIDMFTLNQLRCIVQMV